MKNLILCFTLIGILVFSASTALAAQYSLSVGTTITLIFANSAVESDSHVIQFASALPNCSNSSNRAYLPMTDKAILAIATTALTSNKQVGITYENAAPAPVVPQGSISCKIVSMWIY